MSNLVESMILLDPFEPMTSGVGSYLPTTVHTGDVY